MQVFPCTLEIDTVSDMQAGKELDDSMDRCSSSVRYISC
jgi:hypothetical protein